MPNHVYNEVVLIGVSKEVAAPKILNAKGEVDFGVLLPLPLNYWPGSVGTKHEKAFPGTHLDAARTVWGTKWGAYGDPELSERDGNTVVTFQTAWNHPRGWVCALFNTFECAIMASWISEGGGPAVRERYTPYAGTMKTPDWEAEEIADKSLEHKRLHKCLWGVEEFEEESADE